jgi:hypothetical protein
MRTFHLVMIASVLAAAAPPSSMMKSSHISQDQCTRQVDGEHRNIRLSLAAQPLAIQTTTEMNRAASR